MDEYVFAGPRRSIREELERLKKRRQMTNGDDWRRTVRKEKNAASGTSYLQGQYQLVSNSSIGQSAHTPDGRQYQPSPRSDFKNLTIE